MALVFGLATPAQAKKTKRGGKKGYFTGWVAKGLRQKPVPRPSGTIEIENVHTGQVLLTNLYNPDGTYNARSLQDLNLLWTDWRTSHQAEIDPALFEVLSHVHDRFETRILLYSGHRLNSDGFHFKGSAADIRVPNITLKKLKRFVEGLDSGGMGVGLYPRDKFIHVDVRPPPSYRWIDRSPPGHRRRQETKKKPIS